MARDYPWYEVVQGDTLEQGDFLFNLDILVPTTEFKPLEGEELGVDIETIDAVIMTQSCDLSNNKLDDLVVCPHWHIDNVPDDQLKRRDARTAIRQQRRPRYRLLEAPNHSGFKDVGHRIVDFGRVFSVSKKHVQHCAIGSSERLRLCSPYREYLAQAFGNFFMRVGLPNDIKLP